MDSVKIYYFHFILPIGTAYHMHQLCTMIRGVLKIFVCSTANIHGSCHLSASTKLTSSNSCVYSQALLLSFSLIDCNPQIPAIISYGRGIVQYIIFKTIDADVSLHFSCFKYHSFSVNVKIIFRTNENVKKYIAYY